MSERTQNSAPGRTEILSAAIDLFAEHGFEGTSINAIACRAGTSKANVFHHFGSKGTLYLETMRAACSGFEPVLQGLDDSGRPHAERLRQFVQEDVEKLFSDPDHSRLILREVLESGPSRGRELAAEVFDENFARVVDLFRSGQASGVFRADVPAALAASMAIACNVFLFQSQHVLRHLSGVDFVDDPERYAALIGQVMLDGLRAADAADGSGGIPE